MRICNSIVLASLNRSKFEEFDAIFEAYPDAKLLPAEPILRNASKLGFVETYDTYLDNALAKTRLANMGCHYPTLADDTGLEVEALGGKPGVRSHRFAPPRPGISQDQANRDYLLSQLPANAPAGAKFVCTLALMVEGVTLHATGVLEGEIIRTPRGGNGFGYDPIFVPKGQGKTLAEMTMAEKNTLSHRARAVHALMEQVRSHGIVLAKP